jgi:BASS family bile acid:Na+ symporter
MFAIGWMLPRDEISQVASRWHAVLSGTAIQYLSMPTFAYVLGRQFGLQDDALLGTLIVGCVPGAMASNVLTLMAGGNTSYSVSLTTCATLLSPLVVPLGLKLTVGATAHFDAPSTAWNLSWMVVIPVVSGHLLARRFPESEQTARVVGSIVANLVILWVIAVVVADNRTRLAQVPGQLLVTLLLLNTLGYLSGYLGGRWLRLPTAMGRALTLEVGMQNAGLGTALAATMFPDRPAVTIPTALYTFGCMLTGTMLARVWALRDGRRRSPR